MHVCLEVWIIEFLDAVTLLCSAGIMTKLAETNYHFGHCDVAYIFLIYVCRFLKWLLFSFSFYFLFFSFFIFNFISIFFMFLIA